MTALSVEWLRANPGAPRLIESAYYEQEAPGENDYLALPVSLGLFDADYMQTVGHAPRVDCEDLSIGDAAEERHLGNPHARADILHVSPSMLHIITNIGPGQPIRDLTKVLLTLYPGKKGRPWNL